MPMPRCRIPILIVAAFLPRLPRYTVATVIDDADQQFDAVTLHSLQLFSPLHAIGGEIAFAPARCDYEER